MTTFPVDKQAPKLQLRPQPPEVVKPYMPTLPDVSNIRNINLDNFWNPLKEKCPQTVEIFCNWIDGYKQSVMWKEMFGAKIKFHDLPIGMQIGIIIEFFACHLGCSYTIEDAYDFDLVVTEFSETFALWESMLEQPGLS